LDFGSRQWEEQGRSAECPPSSPRTSEALTIISDTDLAREHFPAEPSSHAPLCWAPEVGCVLELSREQG
jgi:hypothetical protein